MVQSTQSTNKYVDYVYSKISGFKDLMINSRDLQGLKELSRTEYPTTDYKDADFEVKLISCLDIAGLTFNDVFRHVSDEKFFHFLCLDYKRADIGYVSALRKFANLVKQNAEMSRLESTKLGFEAWLQILS